MAVEFALCLRRDRGAVRQGEAVQGRLGVTLQEGCTQTRKMTNQHLQMHVVDGRAIKMNDQCGSSKDVFTPEIYVDTPVPEEKSKSKQLVRQSIIHHHMSDILPSVTDKHRVKDTLMDSR